MIGYMIKLPIISQGIDLKNNYAEKCALNDELLAQLFGELKAQRLTRNDTNKLRIDVKN